MKHNQINENDALPIGENKAHRIFVFILLSLMLIQGVILLLEQRWLALTLVILIIGTLLSPIIFRNRWNIEVPAELHLAAVFFTFASLYLGEIQSFYLRFWWWDMVLHTSAGFLMGVFGFLLVYILNETDKVDLNPGFVSFFAFVFAVFVGTIWEIFEFGMDEIFGLNMQKAMLDDPSGLTDTMWDMIVNAIGASVVAIFGWRYLKLRENFFVKKWIRSFIQKNPRLFGGEDTEA